MLLLDSGANTDNIDLDRYKIEFERKKQLFGNHGSQSDKDFFNQYLEKHIKEKLQNNTITLETFNNARKEKNL